MMRKKSQYVQLLSSLFEIITLHMSSIAMMASCNHEKLN